MEQRINRLIRRGGLWIGLLLLLFTTLYVSAGRVLTPMLNAYRLEVQDWLTGQLGQPLHLGRLHAGWHGLSPRFYAEDVRLGEDQKSLHIERLHFRPDMLGSLLRGSWSLAAVSLQGLEAELQQRDGYWQLGSMALGADADAAPVDWAQWLQQLQRIGHLSLVDASLRIRPLNAPPVELQQAGFTLEQSGSNTRLQASLRLPDGELLQLSAQGRITSAQWQQADLDAYLELPGSNWLQWLAPAWLEWLPQGMQLDTAALSAQAWLRVRQGELQQLTLDSAGGRVQGRWQEQELDIGLGRVRAGFVGDANERRLWLPELNVRWLPHGIMQNLALQVRQDAAQPVEAAAVDIAIGQLQLEPLMAAVLQLAPMPELARDILTQLDFRGRLHNTRLRWQPGLPWQQQLEYDTNLEQLDYSPWEHVPGASGISGRLYGSLAGGELHLDSNDFSLYLRELFAGPWRYQRARARLTWELTESLDFTLTSPYLQVRGDEGRLAGDFVIRLPADPERESYMDLRVGMREGDASHKARYLPLVLRDEQPQLWDWLHESIRGADVHQGYFQYQGSLAGGAPPAARSISLFFDVDNAQLAYQPGWPLLEDGRAQVYVHDHGVEIDIAQGRILQSRLGNVRAEVSYPQSGVSTLQLDARLDSSMTDGLQIVQKTPLAQQLPFMSDWQGQGELGGRLQLSVPFAEAQQPRVVLDLQLHNNNLVMPGLDVRLEQLQGSLSIDSQHGMTADALAGRFLEQPFTASMRLPAGSTLWASEIRARGRMPVKRLQEWLGYAPELPFAGALDYQLDLSLAEQGSQLTINSDLQGVRIDLPPPLAKTETEKVATSWHMTLDGPELHYRLAHGARLNGLFAARQSDPDAIRGQLVLGWQAAHLPARDGLWIAGQVSRLPVPDWLDALERYAPGDGDGKGLVLQELQLNAGQLEGFGIPLEQAGLTVRPDSDGWLVRLDSNQAKGRIQAPDTGPLRVILERLQLPESESLLQGSGGLNAADVPAMDLQIRQLLLGEDVLGTLEFASRPDGAGGVRFDGLQASLKGLQLKGGMHWRGQPDERSSFTGELNGEQLENILESWGYAQTMSSERFSIGLDLDWPGAPQDFAMARLSGSAQLRFRKGQLMAADGSAQVLRVFGLLNFDSIGRRLRLDFSDLLGKGLSYDRIDGSMDIRQGVFRTRDELVLSGISSNLNLKGTLDVPAGTIDADMQLAMPISRNLPLAAVAVGAPAVGGALFLIDRLAGDRFARMAAVRYSITGNWQDPQIALAKGDGK